MYVDSSVLIDYWTTEGWEQPGVQASGTVEMLYAETVPLIRDLLKSDAKFNKMVEIRKKLLFEDARVTPLVSRLAELEFAEWHAGAIFKQTVAEIVGPQVVQRMGRKDVGRYVKRIFDMAWEEHEQLEATEQGDQHTPLASLASSLWIKESFNHAHGFAGMVHVDVMNFNLPPGDLWEDPSIPSPYGLAHMQIGLADIMHVLLAHHLGCQYLASFDSDFRTNAQHISEEFGITVLCSPEEILGVL